MLLKHYVEYLYPGFLGGTTSACEIPERDANKVEISDCCLGFRFFDRTVTVVDGQTFTSDRNNISGWFYRGEKMTSDQIKATFGNNRNYNDLILNIEASNVNTFVRTKFDHFFPLNEDDQII